MERTDSGVRITGNGLHGLQHSRRKLDAGNSGTTMRMLTGILAGQQFESTLTGDASLQRRPMRRVIDPLTQMGAEIYAGENGIAPLQIQGRKLVGIDYTMPVPSAQVKSANSDGGIICGKARYGSYGAGSYAAITRSWRWRNSEFTLIDEKSARFALRRRHNGTSSARTLTVPGDLSSRSFSFLPPALILPESSLVLQRCRTESHAHGGAGFTGWMGRSDFFAFSARSWRRTDWRCRCASRACRGWRNCGRRSCSAD